MCIYEREILESQFDWPAFNLHKSMPVIKGTHLFDETAQQGNSTTSFLLITAIESFSIKDLFKSGVIGTDGLRWAHAGGSQLDRLVLLPAAAGAAGQSHLPSLPPQTVSSGGCGLHCAA